MTNLQGASSNVLRFCSAIALSVSFYGTAQAGTPLPPEGQVEVSTAVDKAGRDLAEDARVENSVPKADAVRYTCPMHPEVVADGPGRCPHCGMKLVEQEQGPGVGEGP